MHTPKIAITFDHSRLGVEKKYIFSSVFDHLHHLYFIRVINWTVPKYNFML